MMGTNGTRTYTRAEDEKLVRALALRDRGHTLAAIALALGVNRRTLENWIAGVRHVESATVCTATAVTLLPQLVREGEEIVEWWCE
jgi:DNA-binding transcriptional MerR regulator